MRVMQQAKKEKRKEKKSGTKAPEQIKTKQTGTEALE